MATKSSRLPQTLAIIGAVIGLAFTVAWWNLFTLGVGERLTRVLLAFAPLVNGCIYYGVGIWLVALQERRRGVSRVLGGAEIVTVRGTFVAGAVIGDALAAAFVFADWAHPAFLGLGTWADRTMFRMCPFLALGFTRMPTGVPGLIAVVLVGNALLYGGLAILLLLAFRLVAGLTRRSRA